MSDTIEQNHLQAESDKPHHSTEKPTQNNRRKRNRAVFFIFLLLLLTTACCLAIWWIYYRGWETTDDAYVGGNLIVLSSRLDGSVIAYHAENSDYVIAGEVLVELDPTDYFADFEKKKATLAETVRKVGTLFQDVQQKLANVQLEKVKHERAELDFNARSHLISSEAIPEEEFLHAQSEFKVSKAALELSTHQLESAQVSLGSGRLEEHPAIHEAKMNLITSYLSLQRCSIKAPASGFIANRNVQVGQTIRAGSALLAIVPLDCLWVDANFKETQIDQMRIGQPVKMTSDSYGRKIVYHGKIVGLFPGTGSTFSLLPAQNATGNWIKIVQRVPVRIQIDCEALKTHPLVLGLTMNVAVDISDSSGLRLADRPIKHTTKTESYEINLKPVEDLIHEIVRENLLPVNPG